jgi:hypothetical protein
METLCADIHDNIVKLTKLLQHLVTLVQDEMFQVLERKFLAPDESQDPARSSHHYVGAVGLQNLLVLRDGKTTEEHSNLRKVIIKYGFNYVTNCAAKFQMNPLFSI